MRLDLHSRCRLPQVRAQPQEPDCLSGLRILDIGCGAGLLCEPLARLGAQVVGVDPSAANIAAAKLHADQGGLVDRLPRHHRGGDGGAGERFDLVLAMEVVEHVTDVGLFVQRCAEMVKPGGLMIVATLNRTSRALRSPSSAPNTCCAGCRAAPISWDKFVTPDELETALAQAGCARAGQTGVVYHPLADRWQLSSDMDVNYMLTAEKPA